VTLRVQAEDILREIATCEDSDIDLAEGALALAAMDRPGVAVDRYRDHVARLAEDVGTLLAAGAGLLGALNDVLLAQHGYAGDTLTYDDIQNANLMRVIDRKKGLPVALGILYMQTARSNGELADGLNFPGHFMIRISDGTELRIVDPFNGGIERTAADLRELVKATAGLEAELSPEHWAAVGNRDVLVRLQNNIKARHERAGRAEDALRVIERMQLFAPDMLLLRREAGILYARLGNMNAAIAAFEEIVERASSDQVRQDAASIIHKLKSRLN